MNLRTGLAALAIATSGVASHAQQAAKTMAKNDSIVNTVKAATQKADTTATITFAQAQKLLGINKAPKGMVKVTRTKAAFAGKVSPKGLDGDLAYTATSKMIRDPRLAPKTHINYGVNYVSASELPGTAGQIYAQANKGGAAIKAEAFVGKGKEDVKGGVKLKSAYNYKLGETSDFSAGPQFNLHTSLEKINDDIKGAFAPEIGVGAQFKHKFDSGVKVGAEANVGVAARLGYDKRHEGVRTFVDRMTPTASANASVGYKDVDFVVGGGKDVHMGNNVTAGLRFNF